MTTGAQEMTPEKVKKVQSLLSHLQSLLSASSRIDQHLAARDGFAFSLLWQTGARGATVGHIRYR